MYQEFFSLESRPFPTHGAAPPFIATPATDDALPPLERCAREGRGIAILSAPEGTGKTAVMLELGRRLSDSLHVVYLSSSNYASRRGLLQAVLFELGVDYAGLSEHEARLQVIEFARNLHPDRDGLLLLVDEADQLSERLLEELRTLANYMHEGRAPLRLVLSGQLALDERLASPELHAVNQRVGCHVVLEPLDRRQSAAYVGDALAACGAAVEDVFSTEALELICVASDGNIRCLHHLCDHALLLAFVAEERPVPVTTVGAALADLQGLPLNWNVPAAAGLDAHPQFESTDSADDSTCSDLPARNAEPEAAIEAPIEVAMETTVIEFGGDSQPAASATTSSAAMRDREYRLEDRYAELDRLAELEERAAPPPPTVPKQEMSAPPDQHDAIEDGPVPPAEVPVPDPDARRTIESDLLAQIAGMRAEVRQVSACGESQLRESLQVPSPREIDEAEWDVIQPEAERQELSLDRGEEHPETWESEEADDQVIATPSDCAGECDSIESPARRADSPETTDPADGARRYAFLFTRLRDRRRDLAARTLD